MSKTGASLLSFFVAKAKSFVLLGVSSLYPSPLDSYLESTHLLGGRRVRFLVANIRLYFRMVVVSGALYAKHFFRSFAIVALLVFGVSSVAHRNPAIGKGTILILHQVAYVLKS